MTEKSGPVRARVRTPHIRWTRSTVTARLRWSRTSEAGRDSQSRRLLVLDVELNQGQRVTLELGAGNAMQLIDQIADTLETN